jgi:hypothetical protein
MHLFATTTADQVLDLGKIAGIVEVEKPALRKKSAGTPLQRGH